MPNATPRDYANQIVAKVAKSRPDFVLALISVGDDILAESSASDWFDWRSLAIAQRVVSPTPQKPKQDAVVPTDLALARALSVCHTPMDAATSRRWKKTFKHLDCLAVRCERAGLELGLVIVPTEFQTNSVLRDTLCRRMGYEVKDIDCELPQRYLMNYANERQIACIDLLPHFRRCGLSTYEKNTRQWNSEGVQIVAEAMHGWLSVRAASLPASNQLSAAVRR